MASESWKGMTLFCSLTSAVRVVVRKSPYPGGIRLLAALSFRNGVWRDFRAFRSSSRRLFLKGGPGLVYIVFLGQDGDLVFASLPAPSSLPPVESDTCRW